MPEVRAALVVFDMAGTTVRDDDAVNTCLRAALAAAGVAVDAAAVNAVMGIPKPEAIRILLANAQAPDAKAVPVIHADFVQRMRDFYRNDPNVAAVTGAVDVFATLRAAGVKVALDTGFDRSITDVILARLGWASGPSGTIDASVTSDEVGRGRPYPDMIEHLMRVLNVSDAARIAKIGDTPSDLQEGTNAGCGWVIGVTNGTHSRAQLEPHPHTHLISDIRQLPPLIGVAEHE